MSLWEDFLDDVFGDIKQPGTVMICFVNRYLEGMDDVKYKIKYDGHEKSGVTTAQNYCIELTPTSFKPIQIFVWSRKAKAWKKLDDVVAEPGRKKLVRKMMRTIKVPGKTDDLPDTQPNKRPDQPAPAPAPGPSPTDPQGITPDQTKNENDQPQAKPRRPVPGEITKKQLRKIFPKNKGGNPTDAYLQSIADELNVDLPKYKLDTPVRRAHFFAQVRQEAGPLLAGRKESLDYPPKRLIAKFGYYKKKENQDEAFIDGRTATHPANQEAIANKAYGTNKNLGNKEPGDGWKFRGRGLKQVTGRYNYSEFTKGYKYIWSDGSDFIENPDLLAAMPHKVRSAVWFWVTKKNANGQHCWEIADEGDSPTTVNKITAIVNSGELGTADIAGGGAEARRKFFILTYSTFK